MNRNAKHMVKRHGSAGMLLILLLGLMMARDAGAAIRYGCGSAMTTPMPV